MQLICLGDSLTYGYGVRRAEAWPSIVREKTNWDVLNVGVNGDTAGGMLIRFNAMTELKPNNSVVFVMGGYNDILYCANADVAKASMGALIQQIAAKGFIPVVGIPTNIDDRLFPEDWQEMVDLKASKICIEEYRLWLMQFCKSFKIPYVDFEPGFDYSWLTDGLHPNKEGHQFMARKVIDALEPFSKK